MTNNISKRGFASMSAEKRQEIARMGGQSSPTNFKYRKIEELKLISSKGGKASHARSLHYRHLDRRMNMAG
ncbi:MAG: KGG domain-containing protein [Candidatus Magasanikiibacteriota bacterium]